MAQPGLSDPTGLRLRYTPRASTASSAARQRSEYAAGNGWSSPSSPGDQGQCQQLGTRARPYLLDRLLARTSRPAHERQQQRPAGKLLLNAGDHIPAHLAVYVVAEHLLGARHGRLLWRALAHIPPRSLNPMGNQLSYPVHDRRVTARARLGPHAEGVDRGPHRRQLRDVVLLEVAAGHDPRLLMLAWSSNARVFFERSSRSPESSRTQPAPHQSIAPPRSRDGRPRRCRRCRRASPLCRRSPP